jgi:HD-GYP domain-containing protein (c-di-GMP phosphodiesterase class II)
MTALDLELEPPQIAASRVPAATTAAPSPARTTAVEWVRWLSDHTGTPWFGWSEDTGELLARSHDRLPAYWPYCNGTQLVSSAPQFIEPEPGLLCCQFAPRGVTAAMVFTSYVLTQTERYPAELILSAVDQQLDRAGGDLELADVPVCAKAVFQRLVSGALAQREGIRKVAQLGAEVEALAARIDYHCEETNLLHSITRQLRLSTRPVELGQLCLGRLQSLIDAAVNIVSLQDQSGEFHFLQSGNGPLDELTLGRLLSQFEDHDWSKPLVRNRFSQSLLGMEFPGLDNFTIVAVADGEYRRGWIASGNLRDSEFGVDQANVLQSVARMLATHIRNVELYGEHEDLMVRFVRSLVSTLDAKDPYTRGHSERVALIARRIGQELGLPDGDLNDIYLSGLLHDIGKIGVDDRILQKPEQLTDEEFRHIQRHPLIGYQILHQLGNLQHILPGVRNHHETYNGRGYPDRMQGEDIPLMARIMAVADSYDAMASDRPYRRGMPRERLEDIFRRGAGHQWDPRVIAAYFAVHEDITRVWESYSPEEGNLLQPRSKDGHPVVVAERTWLRP